MTVRLVSAVLLAASMGCVAGQCPDPAAPVSASAPEQAEPTAQHYAVPHLDQGLIQSPVNILSQRTADGSHTVELEHGRGGARSIINKGHTVELEFPAGIVISFDGRDYAVTQTHFHTPSEHLIDGMTYPMEMHVVCMVPADPAEADAPPRYLVFGLLFRMGEANPVIERVLTAVPSAEGDEQPLEPLYLKDLFHGGEAELQVAIHDFYHYRGSLTTPPYTETVDWLILKHEFEASPEQIAAMNLIEGDNARPIQMLFDRSIDD